MLYIFIYGILLCVRKLDDELKIRRICHKFPEGVLKLFFKASYLSEHLASFHSFETSTKKEQSVLSQYRATHPYSYYLEALTRLCNPDLDTTKRDIREMSCQSVVRSYREFASRYEFTRSRKGYKAFAIHRWTTNDVW